MSLELALTELYETIEQRKKNPQEGSYTCYLFDKGIDKILKKVGEESAETIIAAKNGDNAATVEEMSDLLYHLLILMANEGITPGDVAACLDKRAQKTGNLKKMRKTDKNT